MMDNHTMYKSRHKKETRPLRIALDAFGVADAPAKDGRHISAFLMVTERSRCGGSRPMHLIYGGICGYITEVGVSPTSRTGQMDLPSSVSREGLQQRVALALQALRRGEEYRRIHVVRFPFVGPPRARRVLAPGLESA